MELILAILFFSLASTVCIRLYAKAHIIGEQTVEQNHAVILAQSIAECWIASEGDMQQFSETISVQNSPDGSGAYIYYDQNWAECSDSQAIYEALLVPHNEESEGLIGADISVMKCHESSDPIYSLELVHHIAKRRGSHAE